MSTKKLILSKNKYEGGQSAKTSNSGIFNEGKVPVHYSPKAMNLVPGKDTKYKTNVIYRHASEQEFKKYQPISNSKNTIDNIVSAEDEYYQRQQFGGYGHGYKKTEISQNGVKKTGQGERNNGDAYSGKNYLKQTSSTSSMEHNTQRRVSPSSSPTFFRPHPKLVARDNPPQPQQQPRLNKQNFRIIKKLGEGKFGKVYMVRELTTGFVMAMKVVEKKKIIQDKILEQFIRELKIQGFLNHPNIIDLYGFFHDEVYFYTLMELGCDGQLYNIISQNKNLTEEATSFIIKNLLEAVHHMHENKILHRDIKPENIVLIMGNVKMCDFGWAVNKVKKEELRSTYCGTPLYLSPELLKGYKYDQKVDLWAIGILAYELLFGCSPFQINEQQQLYKILTEEVRFPKGRKVSNQFQEFIRCILHKNPKERLPSSELLRLHFIRKYEQFQTCEELCN